MSTRQSAAIILFLVPSLFAGQERLLQRPAQSAMRPAKEANSKAAAEFRKSQQAFNDGNIDKAIRHLRNGIALDPSNTDAYNDLGVIYYNIKETDRAIEAFSAMVEIDPDCHRAYVNLAFLFNSQGRFADAERVARRAVDLRKMDLKSRYLLGVALASQKKNMDEALENLTASADEFPDAHLEISRILMEKGDFDRAMRSLQTFTKTSKLVEKASGQSLQ